MRIAAGMRNLDNFYSRANVCIACHQNIDPKLLDAGHPEMFFNLERQMAEEPPHWKDEGAWLGPRAWLTGQAAALREISWAQTKNAAEPTLQPRAQGLVWLLRKTDLGARILPPVAAAGEMQSAADRLARNASGSDWNKASTMALLRKLAKSAEDFRDAQVDDIAARRRGEVAAMAVESMWSSLKTEGKLASENLDTAIKALAENVNAQGGFNRGKFAASLQQVEVALELMGRPETAPAQ